MELKDPPSTSTPGLGSFWESTQAWDKVCSEAQRTWQRLASAMQNHREHSVLETHLLKRGNALEIFSYGFLQCMGIVLKFQGCQPSLRRDGRADWNPTRGLPSFHSRKKKPKKKILWISPTMYHRMLDLRGPLEIHSLALFFNLHIRKLRHGGRGEVAQSYS